MTEETLWFTDIWNKFRWKGFPFDSDNVSMLALQRRSRQYVPKLSCCKRGVERGRGTGCPQLSNNQKGIYGTVAENLAYHTSRGTIAMALLGWVAGIYNLPA